MNTTLNYVKEQLLKAGAQLQQLIVLPSIDQHQYHLIHQAQNNMALALATVLQMQHLHLSEPVPTEPRLSPDRLVQALRAEAASMHPNLRTAAKYTSIEQGKLLQAAAVLEAMHPSLFETINEPEPGQEP